MSTVAAFAYVFPVDRLLLRLKFGGALALADWAAAAWVDEYDAARASRRVGAEPRTIVPVPLMRSRQRERGFNQAHEIARGIGQRLGIEVSPVLTRVRDSPPQAELTSSARLSNMRGAFACHEAMRGRTVAIVDDVMTTGATVEHATRALLAAGAASVTVWVVARTLRPDEA
ncbi:MAG: ComF family protein [Pseudomonadota bacterium]|nr:ComF family protein [Pseudomonadota bacterium]